MGLGLRLRRHARGSRRERSQLGIAVVGTFVGFTILILLMLLAAQVLVRLFAVSALTSAATEAAQQVAESPDPAAEVPAAEHTAREELGTYGATRTRFLWKEVDANRVVLEVQGGSIGFVPLPGSWTSIDRTVTVRTERFR